METPYGGLLKALDRHAEISLEHSEDRTPKYQENSLILIGAVALGAGVMIGTGIFALTGQMAKMTGYPFSSTTYQMLCTGLLSKLP
jgi:hypothetical protein